MPSAAPPSFSSISDAVEAAATPDLPVTFPNVRVALDTTTISTECEDLTISDTSLQWGTNLSIPHKQLIMHAVALRGEVFPSCIYAQLEAEEEFSDERELRIVPDSDDDLPAIFKALSAGAAIAESELAAAEGRPDPEEDGPMFSKMPDGSIGAVDFDALLDDSVVVEDDRRFEDVDEGRENDNEDPHDVADENGRN